MLANKYVTQIIDQYHSHVMSGHHGYDKTYQKISQHFWFPDMYKRIKEHNNNCISCDNNRKYFSKNNDLKPIIAIRPMEIMQLDHIGPFPRTKENKSHILSVIDFFY